MTATVVPGRTVAELAAAVGAPPDTVRYYERTGLLKPPRRTAAGYRSYDDGAVDRMRFIQGAQRLGLRLADIRTLLEIRDTGSCPCEPAGDPLPRRLRGGGAQVDPLVAPAAGGRRRDRPPGRPPGRDGGDGRRPADGGLPAAGSRHLVPAPERR